MNHELPTEGLHAVYKPLGMSSYDVIRVLKKHMRQAGIAKPKIGHGGTLDPRAEGVLVVAMGKEFTRKLTTALHNTQKTYEAVVYLGARSETDDSEGPIHATDAEIVSKWHASQGDEVPDLTPFEHGYVQTPPAYSALKIQGKTAYSRVRAGENLDMHAKARFVQIYSLRILKYEFPFLHLEVVCGSGTYIRSLARDIGDHVGIGAYLYALKRTAVGEFRVENALRIEGEKQF